MRATQGGECFGEIRKGRIDLRYWRGLGARVEGGGRADQEFSHSDHELFDRLGETLKNERRQRLGRRTSQQDNIVTQP